MKYQISHHALEGTHITSVKEIAFVMDAPKEDDDQGAKKRKKEKKKDSNKNTLSIKNFGSRLDVSKLKGSDYLQLCWRCRVEAAGDGTKTIMPIRPTMCLTGMLELEDQILRLM